MRAHLKGTGFTIVELLIVIVVISVLATIVLLTFSDVQNRAIAARKEADLTSYYKAIIVARDNTSKTLAQLTGGTWSEGACISAANNPSGIEPRSLAKSHLCWTTYYANLAAIATASNTNLDSLKNGDSRGNPYTIDENEIVSIGGCNMDTIHAYAGLGITMSASKSIPLSGYSGCPL